MLVCRTRLPRRHIMKLLQSILLGGLSLVAAVSLSGARAEAGKLAITGVNVVDTASGEVKSDQTIVITEGQIAAIVPSAEFRPQPETRVVEARGKFLIPGFWDMHVHIAGLSADPKWSKDVILPLLTAMGITGVRDMGGDLSVLQQWRREIESGKLLGPHIVTGGPMLVSGGKRTPEQIPIKTP